MTDGFYSLLEILEAPKRLNNVPKEKIFDYLLESTEIPERFDLFMEGLATFHYWAYLGICIMANDVIDIKELFKDELENLEKPKFKHGSVSEYSVFQNFISFLSKGVFLEAKFRRHYINNFSETLSEDEYNFCITCLKQVYKKEIYPCIKGMFERGHLREEMKPFFTFCLDTSSDKNNEFTSEVLPMKDYQVYTKVGGMIFLEGIAVTERAVIAPLLDYLRNASNNGFEFPNICEIYVHENNIFMFRSVDGTFLTSKPRPFSDQEFVELFYQGYTTFICANGPRVVSIISKKNKMLEEKSVSIKSFKRARLPLKMLRLMIDVIICETEDGNEISAILPSEAELSKNKKLKFMVYNGIYYLKV